MVGKVVGSVVGEGVRGHVGLCGSNIRTVRCIEDSDQLRHMRKRHEQLGFAVNPSSPRWVYQLGGQLQPRRRRSPPTWVATVEAR